MLYVCNYANERYKSQQRLNTHSAYEKGLADKVLEFHEEDLADLKARYPEHFKIVRGGGLWLWKPYIILQALSRINDGDYLFYCDAGAVFIDDLHLMLPDLEASGKDILLVEQPLLSRQFTKSEVYHLMDYHNYEGNQVLSGYILMKKSGMSVEFIQQWFEYMTDIRLAYGKKFIPEIPEFKDFVSHREDQSVLDILKYKWGIEAHRDPSDFGLFPWQYSTCGTYAPKQYPNSHYPVILLCVRRANPDTYRRTYERNLKLHRWGLYNYQTVWLRVMLPRHIRHAGRMLLEHLGLGRLHRWMKKQWMK